MKNIHIVKALVVIGLAAMAGCKKSYLQPDPLSFYEPEATFTTKSGLDAAVAMCDKHLRDYWSYTQTRDLSLPISTEYMVSDLAVAGKTDDGNIFADVATRLTPTNGENQDDVNMIKYFWDETFNGIKYANTIPSFIDKVPDLDSATKHEYMGRAYFHRAFRYLALCFQFGDVPLVTKIPTVPKQNYKTTTKAAIL
ncbi:MAG TPA: RagB/SusD family nutrient uptake outer membrane protein, partial [Puia sp.]|nr:RagB/SusD family nutrient uptake outer membrane protein [Puia sp.]